MTFKLFPLLVLTLLSTQTKIHGAEFKNCPDPATSPASSFELQDLLTQCCATNDGVDRDCCALIFPNVPQGERCCSCSSNNSTTPKTIGSSGAPYGYGQGQNQGQGYDPVAESMALPLFNSDGCHPLTKNVHVDTQRLLNKCCYVNPGRALNSGLDCLALVFPHLPADQRCGQCTSPGTIEDLVYTCCSLNYHDEKKQSGKQRDCCKILGPVREKGDQNFCPCPKTKTLRRTDATAQFTQSPIVPVVTEGPTAPAKNPEVPKIPDYENPEVPELAVRSIEGASCDPRTKNVTAPVQNLLNKCCLVVQNQGHKIQKSGKKLDCLALAFPMVPWKNRCITSCNSDLLADDLNRECCGTKDGLRRNCCALVFPKVKESGRFCPCSSHGQHSKFPDTLPQPKSVQEQEPEPKGLNSNGNIRVTRGHHYPGPGHRHHHHHHHHQHPKNGGQNVGPMGNFIPFGNYIDRVKTAEAAINLHTYCCNTLGKKEFGFNCEKLVLGVEPEINNGNRPCGAWTNTLEPYEPYGTANTDYTDEDYKK